MTAYYNENDKHCCALLSQHIANGRLPQGTLDSRSIEEVQPDDVKNYKEAHFFAGIGGFPLGFAGCSLPDGDRVWTGGFPCTDLSIAGRREGLAGSRSGLFFEFHRLVANCRPEWVVIENVPGLLSSHEGLDFAILVGGFTGIIPEVPRRGWGVAGLVRGHIYQVAYRILDSRYFGVAQRRRRVFIVARLGKGGHPAEVLFESQSLRRNPQTRRKAGTQVTRYAPESPGVGGGDVVGSLTKNTGHNGHIGTDEAAGGHLIPISKAVATRTARHDPSVETMIIEGGLSHAITDRPALDADKDTFVVMQNGSDVQVNDEPGALTAGQARQTSGPLVFTQNQREEVRDLGDAAGSLAAEPGAHQQNYIAFAWQQGDDSNAPSNEGRGRSYIARAGDYSGSISTSRVDAVAFQESQSGVREGDLHPTLDANNGSRRQHGAFDGFHVRRLTPKECERLQNFPDGWTDNGQSDSARYKQLGNAVTVSVIRFIARQIEKVART